MNSVLIIHLEIVRDNANNFILIFVTRSARAELPTIFKNGNFVTCYI